MVKINAQGGWDCALGVRKMCLPLSPGRNCESIILSLPLGYVTVPKSKTYLFPPSTLSLSVSLICLGVICVFSLLSEQICGIVGLRATAERAVFWTRGEHGVERKKSLIGSPHCSHHTPRLSLARNETTAHTASPQTPLDKHTNYTSPSPRSFRSSTLTHTQLHHFPFRSSYTKTDG